MTFDVAQAFNLITEKSHGAAFTSGWWTDLKTGEDQRQADNVPEKLCLIHGEVSEAMEGHRKNKVDDHLEGFMNVEVELADAVIRIGDLAGAKGYRVGDAIKAKMEYNANRADHKIENRRLDDGKKY